MTLVELVVVLAITAVLCAVAVPGVAAARRTFRADEAAHRLALVLREAQARAQASGVPVVVSVDADGGYVVTGAGSFGAGGFARGELGAAVSGNYPGGAVQFGLGGLPSLSGGSSPRAGHFTVADGAPGRTVVVQLGGCIRCV